jgi:hypothetical protein
MVLPYCHTGRLGVIQDTPGQMHGSDPTRPGAGGTTPMEGSGQWDDGGDFNQCSCR